MGLILDYTLKALTDLKNGTSHISRTDKGETMPLNNKKIRREVVVNGVKVWITADSEQEYVDKVLRISGGGRPVPSERHNFREYADRWFTIFSKPNVSQVTALTYERQLKRYIYPVLQDLDVEAVTPTNVQAIFNSMPENAKQDTKNKVKVVLNQIFKMALDDGLISRNPLESSSVRIRGLTSTATEPYTVGQMRFLASRISMVKRETDRAWLALSISMPLRVEEVLGLRWEDVDTENCVAHIRGTVTHPTRNEPVFKAYTKTAASVRDLTFPEAILQFLPERGEDTDFVVGGEKPVSYTELRGIRKRVNWDTGFGETITPRRFRTTVATDISATTHDLKLVQRMLGHSTPQMTLKHYDKGRSRTVDASRAIGECYGFGEN